MLNIICNFLLVESRFCFMPNDIVTRRRWSGEQSTHYSTIGLLISGAISGALAKSAIAPMDRVKIVFQTDPMRPFKWSPIKAFVRDTYTNYGVRSFWRGHTATLLRVAPYSASNFFVFERTHSFLNRTIGSFTHPIGVKFVAGAISGSMAVCVTYPLETLRARMAVDLTGKYLQGYVRAVHDIVQADGFRSLYSGLRPSLIGIVPYAGISFTVYETCKSEDMDHFHRFLAGALAGVVAQTATYPLDVIRRRMQVYPQEYKYLWTTSSRILKTEGLVNGLYKGLSMNMIKGPMAVAISLNANDYIKRIFLEAR